MTGQGTDDRAQLDPATIADWTRRSRESQGLPATITDGELLARVVTLALVGTGRPARRRRPARAG